MQGEEYCANYSKKFEGFYHTTKTLEFDKVKNIVTFKNGDWITVSTNKSQEFFLEDIGLSNLKVAMRNKRPVLLGRDLQHLMVLQDDTQIPMNHLRIWNDGGSVDV